MPDTETPTRARELWAVELGVSGGAWRHQWRGYARDSLDATELARDSLFGNAPASRPLVVVLSCLQVGT